MALVKGLTLADTNPCRENCISIHTSKAYIIPCPALKMA